MRAGVSRAVRGFRITLLAFAAGKRPYAGAEAALGGRRPVVPEQVRAEFQHENVDFVEVYLRNEWLSLHGARYAAPVADSVVNAVKLRVHGGVDPVTGNTIPGLVDDFRNPRAISDADAKVLASAIQENLPVLTGDDQFYKTMVALGWPAQLYHPRSGGKLEP
jgi:hypothetical protein